MLCASPANIIAVANCTAVPLYLHPRRTAAAEACFPKAGVARITVIISTYVF